MESVPDDTAYIYALTDPDDGHICYIGQTVAPLKRHYTHLFGTREQDTSKRANWLRTLERDNKMPGFRVLEVTTVEQALAVEKRWIQELHAKGTVLFNDIHIPRPRPQVVVPQRATADQVNVTQADVSGVTGTLRMISSEAARALRAIPSEKRTEQSRENGKRGGRPKGSVDSAETKAQKAAAQKARRERERTEQP